jgi:hypothetical protein
MPSPPQPAEPPILQAQPQLSQLSPPSGLAALQRGTDIMTRAAIAAREVFEIERKGKTRKIAIVGSEATVFGWIDAAAIEDPPPKLTPAPAWTAPPPPSSAPPEPIRCPTAVAIYLRDGGDPIAVGAYKPNGAIRKKTSDAPRAGEIPVDLDGPEVPERIHAYVREVDVAGCI